MRVLSATSSPAGSVTIFSVDVPATGDLETYELFGVVPANRTPWIRLEGPNPFNARVGGFEIRPDSPFLED